MGAEFGGRLARQSLRWDLPLQPFVSEAPTPVDDAFANRPSSYANVARLELPMQDILSIEGWALRAETEADVFHPWQVPDAHCLLGDVQWVHKVVYFRVRRARGAA